MKVRIGVWIVAVIALFVFAGVLNAQNHSSGSFSTGSNFSLTVSAPIPQVSLGSAIIIGIKVTNVSKSPITLVFGRHGDVAVGFKYDARDPNGKSMKRVPPSGGLRPAIPPGSETRGKLLPGESIEQATRISDLFKFDQPGKYSIQVSRKIAGKPIVRSNVIVITVLPKSESSNSNSGL